MAWTHMANQPMLLMVLAAMVKAVTRVSCSRPTSRMFSVKQAAVQEDRLHYAGKGAHRVHLQNVKT